MRLALAAILTALPLAAQQCDRTCLREILDQYFTALVKHDLQAAPISSQIRFTEDGVELPLGQGLWMTASGMGPARQDVIDVPKSTVGAHALILENGKPVQLAVRLKIFGLKIHEIETMVVRGEPKAASSAPALKTRTAAVDELQGITWVRSDYGPYVAWEMRQVRDGRAQVVSAISKPMPPGAPSGWD